MLKAALAFSKELPKIKKPSAIYISGLGGSAIGGDLVKNYLRDKIAIPITVVRDYLLPSSIKKEDLLICVSYSGNTEEALSVFKSALEKGINIAIITSGGEIHRRALKEQIPTVVVPAGLAPRSALPYLLISLLKVLEKAEVLPLQDRAILEASKFLSARKKIYDTKAKRLAKKLIGKIPIIFSSVGTTEACGYRLKCQFNENSKATAHLCVFPELDHNEIVNLARLESAASLFLLILKDEEDHERIKKRIKITKELIGKSIKESAEIRSEGEGRLCRMLSLVYFGDLVTYHLALAKKVDPREVYVIEKLKEALK